MMIKQITKLCLFAQTVRALEKYNVDPVKLSSSPYRIWAHYQWVCSITTTKSSYIIISLIL